MAVVVILAKSISFTEVGVATIYHINLKVYSRWIFIKVVYHNRLRVYIIKALLLQMNDTMASG